jgi:hypothetical protein
VRITSSWTCEEAGFGIRGSRLKASIRNAAQVVGGVGTDRAAHVSDEMWALFPEPTGQSSSLTGSERMVGNSSRTPRLRDLVRFRCDH